MRKRPALRLAASALAGAVLTVAVAWAFSIWAQRRPYVQVSGMKPGQSEAEFDGYTQFRFQGVTAGSSLVACWRGAPRSTFVQIRSDQPELMFDSDSAGLIYAGGWPFLAMGFPGTISSVLLTPARGLAEVDLPRQPLWPGFVLDTAFYGTLVFLLWSAPGFVRRARRRRRGLCFACGYELKGLEKCPECGRSEVAKWFSGKVAK